ncbi:hypothetical protein WICPIJ_002734 [Wickerhamomyces pijperi]|uniref:Uncharacterized protein n=1 Tax=Wickerhamomyces pijperi TaxID=599730 RepID=A0A9P8TPJ3_WICPI|nr:hypothetical protein WICPIJ_002734 [Wickerhamomyces pijperi]
MTVPDITKDSYGLIKEHLYQQYKLPQYESFMDFGYDKFILHDHSQYNFFHSGLPGADQRYFSNLLGGSGVLCSLGMLLGYSVLIFSLVCLVYYISTLLRLLALKVNDHMTLRSEIYDIEAQDLLYEDSAPELSYSNSSTPQSQSPVFSNFSQFEVVQLIDQSTYHMTPRLINNVNGFNKEE